MHHVIIVKSVTIHRHDMDYFVHHKDVTRSSRKCGHVNKGYLAPLSRHPNKEEMDVKTRYANKSNLPQSSIVCISNAGVIYMADAGE